MGLFITNTSINNLKVARETERAVGLSAWCNYEGSSKSWEMVVWIPRSIIKEGVIPAWFLQKKNEEFEDAEKHVVVELA